MILCAGLMVFVSLDPRLGRYCSPFSVVLAACWVLLFKEVKIPAFAAAIVRFVTPSLFAVYLLHVSNIGNSAVCLCWLRRCKVDHCFYDCFCGMCSGGYAMACFGKVVFGVKILNVLNT